MHFIIIIIFINCEKVVRAGSSLLVYRDIKVTGYTNRLEAEHQTNYIIRGMSIDTRSNQWQEKFKFQYYIDS